LQSLHRLIEKGVHLLVGVCHQLLLLLLGPSLLPRCFLLLLLLQSLLHLPAHQRPQEALLVVRGERLQSGSHGWAQISQYTLQPNGWGWLGLRLG
jgi:hypothetical protein